MSGGKKLLVIFLIVLVALATADQYNEKKTCGEVTELVHIAEEVDSSSSEDDEEDDTVETRVRMGTIVTTKRYPWMVAIYRQDHGKFHISCGGALITKKHVLTAAHCFHRKGRKPRPSDYKFYIGFLNLNQKAIKGRQQIFDASKIHMHPGWSISSDEDDIAVVRLDKPVPDSMFLFKTARVICLPQKNNIALHTNFTVAGWGSNGTEGVTDMADLYEATVHLFTENCPPKRICTKTRPTDVCENDSGGPLMQPKKTGRMQVVGVVSNGPSCLFDSPDETETKLGKFTDVRKYMDWIKETIDNDEKTE